MWAMDQTMRYVEANEEPLLAVLQNSSQGREMQA